MVRVVNRHILDMLIFLDVLLDQLGKLNIREMPWPVGNDVCFDGIANQGQVSNHIQQLVACGLVGKPEFKVIEVALAFDFNLIFFEDAGQPAHFLFCNRLVHDYDGIVDVSALDEVVGQKGLQLMQKAKGSAGSDFSFEVIDVFQSGMLCSQHRAVEINQGSNLVFNCWHGHHFNPFSLIVKRDIGIDGIPLFGCFLLFNTSFIDRFYKWLGASIHDRNFWPIDFNKAVVNTHPYQCGKDMLYRAHFCTFVFKGGSPGGVRNKITVCFDDGLSR